MAAMQGGSRLDGEDAGRLAEAGMRRCVPLLMLSVLLLPGLFLPGLSAHAVTDCSRPNKSGVDMMLCSNDKAATADQIMARAFRDAFNRTDRREALIEDQERWRRTVRDACPDVACLLRVYGDRTSELETW